MHKHLRSFKQNLTQKFCKNLINFEKFQNLSKDPKVRSKGWNAWLNVRKKIIPKEEITLEAEDWVEFWVREGYLGRWRVRKYRERLEKNERKFMLTLYIGSHDSRWIKRCREVLRFKSRQMELLRSYQEVSTTKWPRWIEKLSSIYRAHRNFLDGSRSYRDKFSKTSMDQNCNNSCRERKVKRFDR